MNGYVNIEKKYADEIMKFTFGANSETTITGIYKHLDSLININKLLVANGSFIDRTSNKVVYNSAFNVSKNSDGGIIMTILSGNMVFGIIVTSNDKITKIGG